MPLPPMLADIAQAWKMSFQTAHYLLFLPLAAGVYFVLPPRARRPWLLLASYYFYFFSAPRYLPVLLCGTLAAWLLGLWINAGKAAASRRARLAVSLAVMVLFLAFFKYNGAFQALLAPLWGAAGTAWPQGFFTTAGALGISFYTFTAIGYLIDVCRADAPAEKNLLSFALFLGFFPSVTMGPISRAGGLLPQLNDTSRRFDPQAAADGLRTMAIGYFKKLAVADTLGVFTDQVYGNLAGYSGLTLTAAAVAFAVQLYFDFSGYTDIALGSARLLGIKLPQNFQNPFFATNFSGFWQRWHMSLSSWLQDYIFTPLVWSRWTERLPLVGRYVKKPPVLSAIAVTFLVSGIWHGDTLCFAVWGALQAVYRIGEELCHRALGKPKKSPGFRLRFGKTALVLALWTESLVFFKVGMGPVAPGAAGAGTAADAVSALARQFSGISPAQTARDIYAAASGAMLGSPALTLAFLAFILLCTAAALWADWAQCFKLKGAPLAGALAKLGAGRRWAVYYLLVLGSFAGFLCGGASFLYGGF